MQANKYFITNTIAHAYMHGEVQSSPFPYLNVINANKKEELTSIDAAIF